MSILLQHPSPRAKPGPTRRGEEMAERCNYFPKAAEHLHQAKFSGEDQSQPLINRAEQDPFTVRENREERKKI